MTTELSLKEKEWIDKLQLIYENDKKADSFKAEKMWLVPILQKLKDQISALIGIVSFVLMLLIMQKLITIKVIAPLLTVLGVLSFLVK